MAFRELQSPSFVRFVEVEAAELPAAELAQRIQAGRLTGVVVRRALAPAQVQSALERLEGAEPAGVPLCPLAEDGSAYSIGLMLLMSPPDRERYLAQVPALESFLEGLFAPGPALQPRLLDLLGRLSAGALERPVGERGQPYPLACLRCVPPGAELAAHSEKEQLAKPVYDALRPRLDAATLLSYFVALSPPGAGGALAIYALRVDGSLPLLTREQKNAVRRAVEGRYERFEIELGEGDLILFDAGRHYHRVLPNLGTRKRWTLGGFAAVSRGGDRFYAWG